MTSYILQRQPLTPSLILVLFILGSTAQIKGVFSESPKLTTTISSLSSIEKSNNGNPGKTFCTFSKGIEKKEFSPGDHFYLSSVNDFCIKCICSNTGELNCTKEDCPTEAECEKDPRKQQCCKYCQNKPGSLVKEIEKSQSQLNGGESEKQKEKDGFPSDNSDFISCLHHGKIYKEGESFTLNATGLPISIVDRLQCMSCYCQGGMVLCTMKACSSFSCNSKGNYLNVPSSSSSSAAAASSSSSSSCCEKCLAWQNIKGQEKPFSLQIRSNPENEEKTSNFEGGNKKISERTTMKNFFPSNPSESFITFSNSNNNNNNNNNKSKGVNRNNKKKDCYSGGSYHIHGSQWHPIIGPFGSLECVVCKCSQGSIDCGRLRCSPKREMPCSKPVKVEGHCCPLCVSKDEGSKMCVNSRQDITAYRSHGFESNGTEYILFAFIKPIKNEANSRNNEIYRPGAIKQVQNEVHEWTLTDGMITQLSIQIVTNEAFSNLRNKQTFLLLGSTNEKNLEKFLRRENKLEKRCNKSCSKRISSLEKSLKIHRLISRKNCFINEREVTNA